MKIRKGDCHHEMILPDDFTIQQSVTKNTKITGNGEESEWMTWRSTLAVSLPWLHVGIVSEDFIFVTAICHLIEPLYRVRLRVWRTAEIAEHRVLQSPSFRPDLLIWMDHGSLTPGIVRSVTMLSRRCPWLRQLCLSDNAPSSVGALLRGVHVVSATLRRKDLVRELEMCARQDLKGAPLLYGRPLTPSQWMILRQRMAGGSVSKMAVTMQVKPKTLFSRYRNLMIQLGLNSRAEQFWLLVNLRHVLASAPGLTRLGRNKSHRRRRMSSH